MTTEEEVEVEIEEQKKKPTEGSAVIQAQHEAVEKLKALQTRKYMLAKVPIKTASGSLFFINMWTSKTQPMQEITKKSVPFYECPTCQKQFKDRRRLAIHRNIHNKAE